MRFLFRFFCIILITFSSIGCKSIVTVAELNTLKKVVANKNFEFVANTARPMPMANVRGIENLLPVGSNLGNIDLIGNSNFLIVKNDSIHFDMPYYGIRNLGGGYGSSNAGLSFEGKVEDLKTTFNAKKNSYTFKYKIEAKQESLRLTLILFANNSATLNVTSSHRNAINYQGTWKEK